MKRADIKPGVVYAYNESLRACRYAPVVVLSADLYMTDRYTRVFGPADKYHNTITTGRSSYGNAVGLLMVRLLFALDDLEFDAKLARLRELSSVDAAVAGINGAGRVVCDGADAQTGQPVELGRYELLVNQRYLHGEYAALQAELDAEDRRRGQGLRAAERDRLDRLGTYNGLSARLEALGITGYAAASWENKSRAPHLTFDDMEALLDMAEAYKAEISG